MIKKYGYTGRDKILSLIKNNEDIKDNLSVAAHLIHGSSNGRFSITYAVKKLAEDEVTGVNFNFIGLEKAYEIYNSSRLKDGFNILENGEEIFYISNPALGLWASKKLL